MFDIGGGELLVTVLVAILLIGPKDLPRAMLFAGRWIGRARRMSGAFRAGFEKFAQEGEIRDLEAEWAAKREAILAAHASRENDAAVSASDNPDLPPVQSSPGTIQSPSGDTPPTSLGSSLTT